MYLWAIHIHFLRDFQNIETSENTILSTFSRFVLSKSLSRFFLSNWDVTSQFEKSRLGIFSRKKRYGPSLLQQTVFCFPAKIHAVRSIPLNSTLLSYPSRDSIRGRKFRHSHAVSWQIGRKLIRMFRLRVAQIALIFDAAHNSALRSMTWFGQSLV